eukprot:3966654-Prymnesium_polylepis.1
MEQLVARLDGVPHSDDAPAVPLPPEFVLCELLPLLLSNSAVYRASDGAPPRPPTRADASTDATPEQKPLGGL